MDRGLYLHCELLLKYCEYNVISKSIGFSSVKLFKLRRGIALDKRPLFGLLVSDVFPTFLKKLKSGFLVLGVKNTEFTYIVGA